jgi:hypothetical protein
MSSSLFIFCININSNTSVSEAENAILELKGLADPRVLSVLSLEETQKNIKATYFNINNGEFVRMFLVGDCNSIEYIQKFIE